MAKQTTPTKKEEKLDEVFVQLVRKKDRITLEPVTGSYVPDWEISESDKVEDLLKSVSKVPTGHKKDIAIIEAVIKQCDKNFKFKEVVHNYQAIYKVVFDVNDNVSEEEEEEEE